MKSITISNKVCAVVSLGLLYFHFLWFFDASLLYHYHQPMFLVGTGFLKEFLTYPGGVLEWLHLFLFQFYLWPWAGALMLTLLVLSSFMLVYQSLKTAGQGPNPCLVSYLPVAFLLVVLNQYHAPPIIGLRFLTATAVFAAYSRAGKLQPLFLLLSWPVYLLVGGGAFLYYCALAAIHALVHSREKQRLVYLGAHLTAAVAFPYIAAKFQFFITFPEAFTYLYPSSFKLAPYRFESGAALPGLFAAFPLLLLASMLYRRVVPARGQPVGPSLWWLKSSLFQGLVILVASGGLLWGSHDGELKTRIAIDRFAQQGAWQEVLAHAGKLETYDREVNVQVNRALYFQGRLLEDMFAYPQQLGMDGLFIHRLIGSQVAVPASDLLYDLAHVNGAQVMAYEGLTARPYHPRILRRLAMTNLINREYPAASKFVELLKQSLMHRGWADQLEDLMLNPSGAGADSEIRLKRVLKPSVDFFIDQKHPNVDLSRMLEQHPENRMAFEYLMAYYLLEGGLRALYRRLDQFPAYGYPRLPLHVQEAMLLLRTLSPDQVNLDRIRLDPEILTRFRAFNTVLYHTMDNPAQAEEILRKDFGDTYWFYVRYVSPQQTGRTLRISEIE